MRVLLALVVAVAGCGGGEASKEEKLQGSWVTDIDNCAVGMSFDGSRFVSMMLCGTSPYRTAVRRGTFSVDSDRLTTTTSESTCPRPAPYSESLKFSVDGDNLAVTNASGALVLRRNPSMPGDGAAFTFGCFDSSGGFTPSDLHAL